MGSTGPPRRVLRAAASAMQARGLNISDLHVRRLLTLVDAIRRRTTTQDRGIDLTSADVVCAGARRWLASDRQLRRVFPQQIFHWIIEEAGLAEWGDNPIAESARFHVGQISRLVKGMEASGWTPPSSLKWQVIALLNWGAERARSEEAPLLVSPNAVTITTIHFCEGPAVSRRFRRRRMRSSISLEPSAQNAQDAVRAKRGAPNRSTQARR